MSEFRFENVGVKKNDKVLLSDISFNVDKGDFVCIVGPSGAGKSTLLKQINRLDPGLMGRILWKDKPLSDYEVHALRRRIAYIFQTAVMFPGSVKQNLMMAFDFGEPLGKEEKQRRLELACAQASIPADLLPKNALTLSGGQAQRVGIARMLMIKPEVLLLDEPTASLDVETSNSFIRSLKELKEGHGKDTTFFMVTHRLEEAKYLGDWVLMLADGKMVEFTRTEEFFSNPKTDRAKEFLSAQKL